MSIDTAYQYLYTGALIVFLILIGAMVIRSVIGPRFTDRILSVNMLGTMVISSIAILSRLLKESYLVDVALIYAMISFISVLMLASMFIPADAKAPDLTNKRKRNRFLRREEAPAPDPEKLAETESSQGLNEAPESAANTTADTTEVKA